MSNGRLLVALLVGIVAFQWFGGRKRESESIGSDAVVTITPNNMEAELFTSSAPVLAYFWAPW